MIGLHRFGAPNIEGFDQSIQQIIVVISIDFIDLFHKDNAPREQGRCHCL